MSHNKNIHALESIQELSADLFYKKIREEAEAPLIGKKPGEENLPGVINMLGEENSADKEILASEKNLVGKKILTSEEILTYEENLSGEENLTSEENLPGEENLAGKKNMFDEFDVAGEENLAQNSLPAKEISPGETPASEGNFASEKNLAKKTLPAKKNSPAKNFYDSSFSDDQSIAMPCFVPANEENFASEENFAGLAQKDSSSSFKITSTTTNGDIKENLTSSVDFASIVNLADEENLTSEFTDEKNLASTKNLISEFTNEADEGKDGEEKPPSQKKFADEKKLAGKEKLAASGETSSRNLPVENYDSPLIRLAFSMGMASFGMLMVLRSILPRDGGILRVNALARSIGMSANNVRIQLEALKNKNLIVTHMGGEKGRWIDFTETCLQATENLFLAGEKNLADEIKLADKGNLTGEEKSAGKKIFASGASNRFTLPLRLKEFYFTCLKMGKIPESFQPAVIKNWVDAAEAEGSEYAVAVLLEFLPGAKTSPSAYLHTMLENKIKPSGMNMASAKQLLEDLGNISKTIGEGILPKDWAQAAGKLGIKIKPGGIQELASQQTAILTRLEKFTAQLN
jgi:hypothetical protein